MQLFIIIIAKFTSLFINLIVYDISSTIQMIFTLLHTLWKKQKQNIWNIYFYYMLFTFQLKASVYRRKKHHRI